MLAALHTLEFSFLILLGLMVVGSGLIAMVVVVRVVEPKGIKALLMKLSGKTPPGYKITR